MKKALIMFTCIFMLQAGLGYADAPLKVGIVNFQMLMTKSKMAETMRLKLSDKFKPKQEKLQDAQKAIQKKELDMERKAPVMTPAQANKLQSEILSDKRNLQRMGEDFRQDVALAQEQAMKEFTAKVHKEVEKIAKADKLDLVLLKDAVAFSSSRLDITEKLIKKLS